MKVTEEEAKTKRCQESFGPYYVTRDGGDAHIPMVQSFGMHASHYVGAAYATVNGPQLPTVAVPSHCIGSGCMAWQWSLDERAAWDGRPVGYCGKAGKP